MNTPFHRTPESNPQSHDDHQSTNAPLAKALSHNNFLSEIEQRSFRALISSYEDRLMTMDPEIVRLQTLLPDLVAQREEVVTKLHSCRLAIAPHRRLPNEILSQVFIWSAPEMVPVLLFKNDMQRCAPYNILLLCSRWKHIALGLRQLWNSLEFDLDSITKDFDLRNFTKRAGVLLSRSGPSTLKLRISSKNIAASKTHPNFLQQMMRDLLLRSESRLHSLTLDIGSTSPQFFYGISSGFFDCLQTAWIRVDSIPTSQAQVVALLEVASNLREFLLTSQSTRIFHPTVFLIPWAQLTTLALGFNLALWPSEACTMLSQCTSLIFCTISLTTDGENSRRVKRSSPIVIPSVMELILTIRDISNPYLKYFAFPELRRLELRSLCHDVIYGPGSWLNDFNPFVAHLHKLKNLKVGIDFPNQLMLPSVAMISSLTVAGLAFLTNDTLGKIATGILVPKLAHLECTVYSLSVALDLLESRLKDAHKTTVRDAYILHREPCTEKDVERVKMLRNIGLNITFSRFPGHISLRWDDNFADS